MDNLLLKFQKLPDAQKAHASDPAAMRTLDSLERQYGVNLAELVMRVMVQDVEPAKLDEVLASQYSVAPEKAKELAKHMLDDLFFAHRLLDVPDVKDTLANVPAPVAPLAPQPGASQFLVHPDDVKDLQPHTAALQTAPPPVVDTNPTSVAARLVRMESLTLDEFSLKRFQKVIEARLVDVRDHQETFDILTRPTKIGGMGFDEVRADRMVRELDSIVEELHRRPKPKLTPPPPPAPKPAPTPSVPRTPTPAFKPKPNPIPASSPAAPKPSPVPPGAKPLVAPPPWFRPANIPAAKPAAPPPPPRPTPRPRPVATPAAPSYRDVVTDVRAPMRVMGPVEVLGNLSIDDFRRLGGSPVACVTKIAEEVEALSRDSFTQRAAGISAFRQSPVFRAYLTLGQMAMERKEEVQEIAELLRAQKTPTLTQAEFDAIGQLMRQFRY